MLRNKYLCLLNKDVIDNVKYLCHHPHKKGGDKSFSNKDYSGCLIRFAIYFFCTTKRVMLVDFLAVHSHYKRGLNMKNKLIILPLLATVGLMSACGGGGSALTTAPAATTGATMAGSVTKGAVNGATVNILGSDGITVIVSNILTDQNGNWNATLPVGSTGIMFVQASGGSYVNEANGATVTLQSLTTAFDSVTTTSVAVTPITSAMTMAAQADAQSTGTPLSTALTTAVNSYKVAFGLNPLTTLPPSPAQLATASPTELDYAAILGGYSQIATDAFTVASVGDPTVTLSAMVNSLIFDLAADGIIDGIGPNGSSLTIGNATNVAASLPGGGGATALMSAVGRYINGANVPAQLAGRPAPVLASLAPAPAPVPAPAPAPAPVPVPVPVPAPAAGTLTITVTASGFVTPATTITGVVKPTTQAQFCADPQVNAALKSQAQAGATLTINSCTFSPTTGLGDMAATLTLTTPIAITTSYSASYKYQ
ncbi:MAG: hypothetical protein Q9M31_07410 [Mariprofundus sp.]|nr:hypothetical protein [Mariprofundus sp.]